MTRQQDDLDPVDDRPTVLLFGESAARREILPAVRREAGLAGLGILPCEEADEAANCIASRCDVVLSVIAWPDAQAAQLIGFVERLRRNQANPLQEIVVLIAAPLADTSTARLRTARVTRYRRRPPHADEFGDVLATAVRHALEKRALNDGLLRRRPSEADYSATQSTR